jgi:hypothetical protein
MLVDMVPANACHHIKKMVKGKPKPDPSGKNMNLLKKINPMPSADHRTAIGKD